MSLENKSETELRQELKMLRQRNAELELLAGLNAYLIDQTHDSIIATDLTGVITGWNKGAERMFGYPAEEALEQHITFVYPAEEHAFLQQQIEILLATGEHDVEVRMRRKSGEDFYAHLFLSLLKDETGEVMGLVGFSRDITKWKQAEELLRISQKRYQTLAQASPVGIFQMDTQGQCIYVNERWSQITGFSYEEALGWGWINSIYALDRPLLLAEWQQAVEEKQDFEIESRLCRPDGEIIWIVAQSVPDVDEAGNLVGYVGVISDFTERKEAEYKLQELNEELLASNEELRVTEEQLLELNTELRYSQARVETLYQISHTLNQARNEDELLQALTQPISEWCITGMSLFYINLNEDGKPELADMVAAWHAPDQPAPPVGSRFYLSDFAFSQLWLNNPQEPTLIADVESDERVDAPLQEIYQQQNIKRLVMLPLRVAGRWVGLMSYQWSVAFDFEANEVEIYRGIMGLAAAAVENRRILVDLQREIIERNAVEAELEMTQYSLDHSADAVHWVTPEGYHIYVNEAACNDLGYSREELLFMHVADIGPSRVSREKWAERMKHFRNRGTFSFESVHRRRDGTTFPVELKGSFLNFRNEEFICVFARDITERQQAREEQQKFVALIENSRDFIGMATLEGQGFYLNPAGAELVGLDDQAAVENTMMADYLSPETLVLWQTVAIPTAMQNGFWKGQSKFRHFKTGELIDVEGNLFVVTHPQTGAPVCFATVSRDITERKQAEESIRESNARMRAVLESTDDLIVAIDLDYRYLAFNTAYQQVTSQTFGVDIQVGDSALDLYLYEEEKLTLKQNIDRVLTGESFVTEEIHGAHKQNLTYFELSHNPIIQEDGKIIGATLFVKDVTERRRMEDALRESNERLEKRVAERTAELVRAKEVAEAANRAKSEFLSNMSHELRTPLNGILGYTQILKREKNLSPFQDNALNIIQQSGEHLLTLINDILDLAKIEAQRMDIYPTTVHLDTFLEGVAGIIQMRAQQKDLKFVYEPVTRLPSAIKVDEKRLRQILLNLLTNAIKFTDTGRVLFQVREVYASNTPPGHLKLRFEVIDTGIGISPEQQERIFSPFEQVSDRHRQSEGTGLGLAISRKLVRTMGSELYVESKADQGTTFWFELKLPVVRATQEPVPPMAQQTIVGYKGRRRQVLVVDDRQHNRSLLVNMLEPLGFEVSVAPDGQQAIEQVRQLEPDIVFMDMIMPVMTGFEATQKIRQMPGSKNIVIIGASASVFEEDKYQVELAGCDAFLAKPLSMSKVLELLGSHLQLEWLYEETAGQPTDGSTDGDETEKNLIMPPPEQLATLYELAKLGNMRKIREQAQEFEQLDDQYKPFARKLQKLAEGFEKKQLVALIERNM